MPGARLVAAKTVPNAGLTEGRQSCGAVSIRSENALIVESSRGFNCHRFATVGRDSGEAALVDAA